MTKLSVLDLVPVREGGTLQDAFAANVELARTAEQAGYQRFWIAEHHAMEGIAGGATSVVIGHIGGASATAMAAIIGGVFAGNKPVQC